MPARGSDHFRHLRDGQAAGNGEVVGFQLGGIEGVQVHVDVDLIHAGSEIFERGVEAVQILDRDADDLLLLHQLQLRRIEVAGSDVDHVLRVQRMEAGELRGQGRPAAAHGHGDRHAVEVAGGRGVGCVQVAMGVHPDHSRGADRREAPDRRGVAVAGEDHGEPPRLPRPGDPLGDLAVQERRGGDLGQEAVEPDRIDFMIPEPLLDQVERTLAHPQPVVARVVRRLDQRDLHSFSSLGGAMIPATAPAGSWITQKRP